MSGQDSTAGGTEEVNGYDLGAEEIVTAPEPEPPTEEDPTAMASHPVPGKQPSAIHMLHRSLPEHTPSPRQQHGYVSLGSYHSTAMEGR